MKTPTPSRRRFLQALAAVTAAPWARAALPGLGLAAAAAAARAQAPSEETPVEVGPWLEILKQRYGQRLSPEQLQAIQENLGWTARTGKTLRAAALTNADEPDVVFRALPPEAAR
ncbi:MAG TPA: hypothetical protein VFE28_01425 [Candidatus Krumholzibacteria bacterium]|nr:hypothetical protein [Candidatus Krumholzibacteria bacterium]